MDVAFVYSNPGHHAEMMAPVMTELDQRGLRCRAISLAELRGFKTRALPQSTFQPTRAIPLRIRKSPSSGSGSGAVSRKRQAAQSALWTALAPRLLWLMGRCRVVVVPNDAAFPYRSITKMVRRLGRSFVLMQEGIRFPLPGVSHGDSYGSGGASEICAWGQVSAKYFRSQGADKNSISVTGNPRLDSLDVARWTREGQEWMSTEGFERAPLLYLSNPIDDQGFCSHEQKLDLFGRFADCAGEILSKRDQHLVVKLHPREDTGAFRDRARSSVYADRIRVVDDAHLFALLAVCQAAVVLASTVGLEALCFGRSLGVLSVPGAGFLFDYVSSGTAVGIDLDSGPEAAIAALLDRQSDPQWDEYLEQHLAHRGGATARVADAIERVRGTR